MYKLPATGPNLAVHLVILMAAALIWPVTQLGKFILSEEE